jgi:hypothetical protein
MQPADLAGDQAGQPDDNDEGEALGGAGCELEHQVGWTGGGSAGGWRRRSSASMAAMPAWRTLRAASRRWLRTSGWTN